MKAGSSETYPEPVSHCEICRWWKECDNRPPAAMIIFRLLLGPPDCNARNSRSKAFLRLERLATASASNTLFNPSRGAREGYTRIPESKPRIQLEARTEGRVGNLSCSTAYRALDCFRLPSPSIGDIFFDLEGDPFVDDGGLEFLFGVIVTIDEAGNLRLSGTLVLLTAHRSGPHSNGSLI